MLKNIFEVLNYRENIAFFQYIFPEKQIKFFSKENKPEQLFLYREMDFFKLFKFLTESTELFCNNLIYLIQKI